MDSGIWNSESLIGGLSVTDTGRIVQASEIEDSVVELSSVSLAKDYIRKLAYSRQVASTSDRQSAILTAASELYVGLAA